jgi:hypothetical protein
MITVKNDDPALHGTSTSDQPLLVISTGVGLDISTLNAPPGPVLISSDPPRTVAPVTGDPDGSITFPYRVDEAGVVVVVGATVVDVVEVPAATEVGVVDGVSFGSVTSTPAQAETTTTSVESSARNRVGFTRTWYVSGPT